MYRLHPPYFIHANADMFRVPGSSDSSLENILTNVKYFQSKTSNENVSNEEVLFLFNSNYWDVYRFFNLNLNKVLSHEEYNAEFARNYTQVINAISELLRPKDRLILITTHRPHPNGHRVDSALCDLLRTSVLKAALAHNLPVFRTDLVLKHCSGEMYGYLRDDLHQNQDASVILTKEILHSFIFSD